MSGEHQLYPGVKISGDLVAFAAPMQVWLWDCGPEEPDLPEPPEPPSGKDGDPKFDLAKIQYKRKLRAYEAALEKFERDQIEYANWQKHKGGPIEIQFWSCDASDALKNDARAVAEGRQTKQRWYVSARTRGHEKLKNGGLPLGLKPGHGHQANLERQIAGEKEFLAAMKADPVFGQEIRS